MRKEGIIALIAIIALVSFSTMAGAADPKPGGTLRIATIGEPPGLDTMQPVGILAQHIAKHMYENLFTWDENWSPQPMLVDEYEVADGGRRYVFHLRQGVRFHNGEELTAQDVVASLERWMEVETTAKQIIAPKIEAVEAKGQYTVEVRMSAPSGLLIYLLAADGAPIYPKSVIDKYGLSPIREYVGTGPYKFSRWLPDRYIELVRNDDYTPRAEPASGFAGERVAYADALWFIPVPDVSVRTAGVETGEYDIALDINPDAYVLLKDNPAVQSVLTRPFGWPFMAFNKAQGPFADTKVRQAWLASLDMDELMAAGFGDPSLYEVQGSIYPKEIPNWYTETGLDQFNQNDVEKAKKLLEEAGYRGEPIRILTSRQYDFLYKISLVAAAQARRAGFNVQLDVVEWATLVQKRSQPSEYEIFLTFNSFSQAPPLYQLWLFDYWPGWWKNEEKDQLLQELDSAATYEEQFEVWDKIQGLIWQEVPVVKVGDFYGYVVAGTQVKGLQARYTMPFWNVWLD